jgi:hypothetical protein
MQRANQLAVGLFVLIAASPVAAQEVSIYPADGQTLEQQEVDRIECNARAVRGTGFDPAQPPTDTLRPSLNIAQRGMIRDVAPRPGRGVAGYPVFGMPVGPLPGALFGTTRGADLRRQQQVQQQVQQQHMKAAIDDQRASYNQAISSCLRVRGYDVR